MKNFKKIAMWTYLALSLIAAVFLAVGLFVGCEPITGISLLIQAVGLAFVSGMYFDW